MSSYVRIVVTGVRTEVPQRTPNGTVLTVWYQFLRSVYKERFEYHMYAPGTQTRVLVGEKILVSIATTRGDDRHEIADKIGEFDRVYSGDRTPY